MFHDDLRQKYKGPFDEERVWVSRFEGHTFDRDKDEMEEIIGAEADRLENTFNCVTMIESFERHTQLGPAVVLVVVLSRTADRDVFEVCMGPLQHRITDQLLESGK